MPRFQGSNSCPTSDLELRHLQVTLKWWSKSCIQRKQTRENVNFACWSTEYMMLVFQVFCYVSSILCFCFSLSFGNSSSNFSLGESKTLNFWDEGRMKVSGCSTDLASHPLQPGQHQGAWGRASLLSLTWLREPLLRSPQVMPPFCASTTQFMKPEVLYLLTFGSSPWCRVGFCLFCYVMQNKKGVWEIEISQCKL